MIHFFLDNCLSPTVFLLYGALLALWGARSLTTRFRLGVALIAVGLMGAAAPSVVGLPVALTNAALLKLPASTLVPMPVVRFGVNAIGDAPPSWWWRQAGTCAANSMTGDIGSCNDASDGNSFVAVRPSDGFDVREFGADSSGINDATAAINACLAAASGKTCVGAGGVYKSLTNISIPANTTLDLGATFPDVVLTGPRIMLDPAHSILFGSPNAALRNFLVVPNGMTFPQTSSSAWAGTALNTQGSGSVQIENGEVVGFDVCLNGLGTSRPAYRHLIMDCNGGNASGGSASQPTSASMITGNEVDSGFAEDVKLQVVGTSSSCPNRARSGTGWLAETGSGGGIFVDQVVVQDFANAQYYLKNYANFMAGRIWVDFASVIGCAIGTSRGFVIDNTNSTHIDHLNMNGMETGLSVQIPNNSFSKFFTNWIGDIFFNAIGQDAVVMGNVADNTGGGVLSIGDLRTNAQASGNAGRFAVNYLDPTATSTLQLSSGALFGVNGGAAPYISIPSTVFPSLVQISPNVTSNLSSPNALYGAESLGTCTGLGTGACSLMASSRATPWSGTITLAPIGSPAASGSVPINWPLSIQNDQVCVTSLGQGNAAWLTTAIVQTSFASATQTNINWQTGGTALTAGSTYVIVFNCQPQ